MVFAQTDGCGNKNSDVDVRLLGISKKQIIQAVVWIYYRIYTTMMITFPLSNIHLCQEPSK